MPVNENDQLAIANNILMDLKRQLRHQPPLPYIADGDPLSIFCEAGALLITKLRQDRIEAQKKWWVDFWQFILNIEPLSSQPDIVVIKIAEVAFACPQGQIIPLNGTTQLKIKTTINGNREQPKNITSEPDLWPLQQLNKANYLLAFVNFLNVKEIIIHIELIGRDVSSIMTLFIISSDDKVMQALIDGHWSWRNTNRQWVNDVQNITIKKFPTGLFIALPRTQELRCVFRELLTNNGRFELQIYSSVILAELINSDTHFTRNETFNFNLGGQLWHAMLLDVQRGRKQETDDEFITRCQQLFRSCSYPTVYNTEVPLQLITPREIKAGIMAHFANVRWVENYAYAGKDQTGVCVYVIVEPSYMQPTEQLTKRFPKLILSASRDIKSEIYNFLEKHRPIGWQVEVGVVPIRVVTLSNIDAINATQIIEYACNFAKPVLVKSGCGEEEVKQALLNSIPNLGTANMLVSDVMNINNCSKCIFKLELVWPVLEQ